MSPLRLLALLGALGLITHATVVSGAGRKNGHASFRTTHVTVYDCGLAQLERQARIQGAQQLAIEVSLAHLDDLLASLVLATDGSVRVKGVNYPSVQNLGQAVAASGLANALSVDDAGLQLPADLPGYARALVGTQVQVTERGGRVAEGTVLACVDQARQGQVIKEDDGTVVEQPPAQTLVLVTGDGALAWIPLEGVARITPTSAREAAALGSFATQLGKAKGFTETTIVLETTASSRGRLAASYIRQAPLWRTIYKVSASPEQVTLEAWAVVHNDTGEDWEEVEMTLLSGLPKSYVLSLASPRYAEREGLALEEEGNMMPQLGAATPDSLLYDWQAFGYGGLGMVGYGAGGGGSGAGMIGLGRLATIGHGAGGAAGEASSSLIQVGEAAAEEQMAAVVEGEISTYRALDKVSIAAGTSSLVPVIRRRLEGQAFTFLTGGAAPATCVRARNGTGLVLQRGMGSFYVNGRFRGQSELERTEPGDLRIWCYGEDPDVQFERSEQVSKTYTALEWRDDRLWAHNLKRTTVDYAVENLAGQARQLAVDVRHIDNGRVISPAEMLPGMDDNQKLFLFEVPARSEHTQRLIVEEGVMSAVAIDIDALWDLSRKESLPKEQRTLVAAARRYLVEADQIGRQVAERSKEIERKRTLVGRHRANLEAVPQIEGSSRKVDEILGQVLKLESAIQQLEDKIEVLEQRIEERRRTARQTLARIARKG